MTTMRRGRITPILDWDTTISAEIQQTPFGTTDPDVRWELRDVGERKPICCCDGGKLAVPLSEIGVRCLLAKFNKNNHMTEYYDEYRKMPNMVQREMQHAKQHYLVNKIDDNKHDSKKKLWQNLKELGYQNKSKDSSNIVLDIDGKKWFESKEVAGQFNKFFTGVAAKLVGELPHPSGL